MAEITNQQASCIPTRFAIAMAESVGLYSVNQEFRTALDDHERLETFQSICISGSFDESLAAAYFGKSIDDKQKMILQTIHRLTTKWVIGKLSQNLMDRLDLLTSLAEKGKDVSDLADKIIDLVYPQTGSANSAKKKPKVLIEFTSSENKKSKTA